jgi:DNA-binding SARP family transcriptional activator/Flp pilus assembly protein TadD
MVYLTLFGGASLEDEHGALTGPATQRHRLALLALLAATRSGALSRDRAMVLLWPERDAAHARKLLNQSLYVLRRSLGEGAVRSAAEMLRLETRLVACDLVAFDDALAAGELERAVELYAGPFLDGFHLNDAPEFEQWVDSERARRADSYAQALEELADAAAARDDIRAAVEWWKARATHDPYDSRVAFRLVEALAAAGNPAGSLQHAAAHERLLREELGIDQPPDLGALVDRLHSGSAPPGRWHGKEQPPPSRGYPGAAVPEPGPGPPLAGRTTTVTRPQPRRLRLFLRTGGAVLLVTGVILAAARLGSGNPQRETTFRRAEHGTTSIAAYELYLRGSDPALFRSESAARRGLEYFRRAIALDSAYAGAWAGLSRMSVRLMENEDLETTREQLRTWAQGAAETAVALDSTLAEAHAALGLARMADFRFPEAETHIKRAMELDPHDPGTGEWLITVYLWTGRPTEALVEAERALALDPLSAAANAEAARALAANGRCDEALARLEALRALDPPLLRVGDIAARCHARSGTFHEAIEMLRPQAGPDGDVNSRGAFGHMLARADRRTEALRIRDGLVERWRRTGTGAFAVAVTSAGLGDVDATLEWLEQAIADRSVGGFPHHYQLLSILLESLPPEPRLKLFVERFGLEGMDAARNAG